MSARSEPQLGAQAREAEPDPALGGAERHAGARRDLVGGQPAPVGEHERLALRTGRRPSAARTWERSAEASARWSGCASARADVVGHHDLEPVLGAPGGLAFTPQVDRAAAGHQPQVAADLAAAGVELLRVAPDAQEHVLHHVLGGCRAAQHAVGGRVDAAPVLVVDAAEDDGIAEVHRCVLQVRRGVETKASYPCPQHLTHSVEGWQRLCGTCVQRPCKNLGFAAVRTAALRPSPRGCDHR